MWTARKQTLPSARRASTANLVKKPKAKKNSAWTRFSLRNPSQFDDEILASGLGPHPDFMIPTETHADGMRLDGLRGLNMGHINVRYHQDYFNPKIRGSLSNFDGVISSNEKDAPMLTLPQGWKRSSSVTPVKVRQDRTVEPRRRSTSAAAIYNQEAEFNPIGRVKDGFFTVDQGIGTARGASPFYKRLWEEEDDDGKSDTLEEFSLLKSANVESSDPKQSSVADGTHTGLSEIGARLQSRSKKLHLWQDSVNPQRGKPMKPVVLLGVAATSQKAKLDISLQQLSSDQEPFWPINNFIHMLAPLSMRMPERISAEEQRLDLEKGAGIGARSEITDLGVKAEALRRQMDPNKYKEEGRAHLAKGILHDNAQEFSMAVESYQKYLELCEKMGNVEGQALAYNYMGCSIQERENLKLAAIKNVQKAGYEEQQIPEPAAIEYRKALEYHKLCIDKSNTEGKFICYTNLGLLCSTLSLWAKAANYHKKALKCATDLESSEVQCVAVGNLGFLLFRRKKYDAAKSCMMRYLQICEILGFVPGIARAYYFLGDIAAQYERYKEAEREFKHAMAAAIECGDKQMQTICKVQIGICRGNTTLTRTQGALQNPSIFDTV